MEAAPSPPGLKKLHDTYRWLWCTLVPPCGLLPSTRGWAQGCARQSLVLLRATASSSAERAEPGLAALAPLACSVEQALVLWVWCAGPPWKGFARSVASCYWSLGGLVLSENVGNSIFFERGTFLLMHLCCEEEDWFTFATNSRYRRANELTLFTL